MADKKYGLWLYITFASGDEPVPVSLVVSQSERRWWALWPQIPAGNAFQGFWRPTAMLCGYNSEFYPVASEDASSPDLNNMLFALEAFCPGGAPDPHRYPVSAKKYRGGFVKSPFPDADRSFLWSVYLSPD
jgi:hypothetical protein